MESNDDNTEAFSWSESSETTLSNHLQKMNVPNAVKYSIGLDTIDFILNLSTCTECKEELIKAYDMLLAYNNGDKIWNDAAVIYTGVAQFYNFITKNYNPWPSINSLLYFLWDIDFITTSSYHIDRCSKFRKYLGMELCTFIPECNTRQEDCSICLRKFRRSEVLRHTPCSHQFHVTCIDNWLRNSTTCPLCRRKLDVRLEIFIYHKLYS